MLKVYPIRPKLFEPVRPLGVNDSDWPVVVGLTFVTFIVLFWTGFVVQAFFAGLGVLGGSIFFFNWARMGRRRGWLRYKIRAAFAPKLRGRTLGCDHARYRDQPCYILDAEEHADLPA